MSDQPDSYPIPAERTRVEDEIRGSRFITTVAPAPTVEAARVFLEEIRAEFSDATHNCYAWVVGPPGNTRATAASDDGEPSATAGRPMLGVLLGSDVGDVAAVVTRYFGGVKLGRGGLVRAYAGGVQHALRVMRRAQRVVTTRLAITLSYAAVDAARRLFERFDASVREDTFGNDVRLVVDLPAEHVDALSSALGDVTSGAARVERLDETS